MPRLYAGFLSDNVQKKTAFVTHSDLFQFKVMPFRLCNVPATLEQLMDLVLKGLRFSWCLVYLDDIISFGNDFTRTLANVERLFNRLRKYGLQLKSSKCHIFRISLPGTHRGLWGSAVRPLEKLLSENMGGSGLSEEH